MTRLKINQLLFSLAFFPDADFQNPFDRTVYLDLTNGEILYLYSEDQKAEWDGYSAEENIRNKALIDTHPENFLEVASLSHGKHHQILQEFLASPWTDDKVQYQAAAGVYYGPKSIGYWLKNVQDDDAVKAYFNYREERMNELALEFLRQHGIEPEWV